MTALQPSALNGERRARELERLTRTGTVDVLVVGGGVTGAGVALDAASRGLGVALIEAGDLAFGTSRWSSKLVHGGLRYLAKAQFGVAYESAVERGILMQTTAPHLTRPLPMVLPALPSVAGVPLRIGAAGFRAGDGLRRSARTPRTLLPRPRRLTRDAVLALAPCVRPDGLGGGVMAWDGQLEDDARLVVALARTAARHGASILTRVRALELTGNGRAAIRDELTGAEHELRARVIINATGVWAAQLVPGVALRPARGTHLVFDGARFAGLRVALTLPIPGAENRNALVLPQPDGRVYVGLTDEDAGQEIPDVPIPAEHEIGELLDVLGVLLEDAPHRGDVAGAFAGLRPLLDTGPGRTADLSRAHLVHRGPGAIVTIVGGKLTTYRHMAEQALDAAVELAGLEAQPGRTRRLPLVGAADRRALAAVDAPARLVHRYGTEAAQIAAGEPVVAGLPYTGPELRFGVTHELALDAGDLLDRRTRIGLVATDRDAALAAADAALRGSG